MKNKEGREDTKGTKVTKKNDGMMGKRSFRFVAFRFLCLRSRMKLLVHGQEAGAVDVRIDLGG